MSPLSLLFNLKAGPDCKYVSSPRSIYPTGMYDIASQGACLHPYTVHFGVRSKWRNEAPTEQQLIVDTATITLIKFTGQPALQFGSDQLPNPFQVATNLTFDSAERGELQGIAVFELIPVRYARALVRFLGAAVYAQIRLNAHTSSGEAIESGAFEYKILICETCLTVCGTVLADQHSSRQSFIGDICDDNSGNDDRICIDPGC